MKKNLFLLFVFISVALSVKTARAEFLLDPYAGMAFNSSAELAGSEAGLSGTTVGARFGFYKAGFSLGADVRRNSWELDPDSGADSTNYTFTQTGLLIGYELPAKVRFWGVYVFGLEGVNDDDTDLKYKEGSGLTFGFGLKVLAWLSANFEISNLSTAKFDNGTTEVDLDADYTVYTLSISIPLVI